MKVQCWMLKGILVIWFKLWNFIKPNFAFFFTLDVPEGVEGDEEYWGYRIMMNAAEQAEEFAISIWHKFQSWKVIHFSHLPQWLQDNDFLHFGHRPPLPTSECFKSIIRIHTETGNIWTHLLGTKSITFYIFTSCNNICKINKIKPLIFVHF